MKIFIWVLAIVLLVPWTGGAWLAYALVDVSGDWMSGNADMVASEPQVVETVSWLGRLVAGVGEAVIIAVWALGTLSVVAIAWLLSWLVGRNRRSDALQWHPDDPRAAVDQRIP